MNWDVILMTIIGLLLALAAYLFYKEMIKNK